MVQASTGTGRPVIVAIIIPCRHRRHHYSLSSPSVSAGRSFLLTTVFLWCLMEGIDTKAAAPTGIAAANVEIDGTQVSATTVHNLFDFNSEHVSQLDFRR